MFATWKFNPETKEVQSIRQAFDPETARSSQHQACNRCHEKKVRRLFLLLAAQAPMSIPSLDLRLRAWGENASYYNRQTLKSATFYAAYKFLVRWAWISSFLLLSDCQANLSCLDQLKCSGDKDGCDRCASQGLNCEYSRSGSRHSRRGKKSGDRLSPCSSRSGRDGSLSPASMASSQPSTSSKSKRSRTVTAQRARGSVTESRPRTVQTHDNLVNQGEYTIMPGQGTYDLNMLAATTASVTSGYPATSLGAYSPPHGGAYQDEWMVSSTVTTPGYLATAGTSVYASSEGSYPEYPQYENYSSYQGADPRYWGHGAYLTPTTLQKLESEEMN